MYVQFAAAESTALASAQSLPTLLLRAEFLCVVILLMDLGTREGENFWAIKVKDRKIGSWMGIEFLLQEPLSFQCRAHPGAHSWPLIGQHCLSVVCQVVLPHHSQISMFSMALGFQRGGLKCCLLVQCCWNKKFLFERWDNEWIAGYKTKS